MSFFCHSSRLPALGWPQRRFQALLRPGRPSAPPPLVPTQPGKSPLPTLGKKTARGQSGEARTRERWREVSTNPPGPERLASSSAAQTPPHSLFQLKRQHKTGLRGHFPFLPPPSSLQRLPLQEAATPLFTTEFPGKLLPVAPRGGVQPDLGMGGRGKKSLSPTPCKKKKRCKRIRIVESPLPLQNLGFFPSPDSNGWGGREKGAFGFFSFPIILSQPESRRFPLSDLRGRLFRFSDICIENGVSSGFEKWYRASVLGRLSIYPS